MIPKCLLNHRRKNALNLGYLIAKIVGLCQIPWKLTTQHLAYAAGWFVSPDCSSGRHFCVDWSVLCSHRTVFRKGEPRWASYTQLTLRVQGPGVTGTEHLLWISCKGRGVAGSSGLKWRPLICRCWARLTRDTETVCELCTVGCY